MVVVATWLGGLLRVAGRGLMPRVRVREEPTVRWLSAVVSPKGGGVQAISNLINWAAIIASSAGNRYK